MLMETITDGLDYEVPDDREVENPTGRLMVTVDVSSWGGSFPCKVCGEGFVDKAGLRQHMIWVCLVGFCGTWKYTSS